jgi:hypothetical protein
MSSALRITKVFSKVDEYNVCEAVYSIQPQLRECDRFKQFTVSAL